MDKITSIVSFEGVWCGTIKHNHAEQAFIFEYNCTYECIYISLPEKYQYNLPITKYVLNGNCISFYMLDNFSDGIIRLIRDGNTLLGLYITHIDGIYEFKLHHEMDSDIISHKPIYQIWPKQDKLLCILKRYCNIDFSNTCLIQYPDRKNHSIYYDMLNKFARFDRIQVSESLLDNVLRILRWTYKICRQKERASLPLECDGLSLLMHTLQKNSLNCKGCSVILTDVLLSFGYKARMVHCRAQDNNDPESHYMVECYINDLEQWIALDAAFGCIYISNYNILNIAQIRESIVLDQELLIHSSIKNRKNDYLSKIKYGIIKNFFQFDYYKNYNPGFANSAAKTPIISIIPEYSIKEMENTKL